MAFFERNVDSSADCCLYKAANSGSAGCLANAIGLFRVAGGGLRGLQGVVSVGEGGDPDGTEAGVLIGFRADNRGERKGFERVFVAMPRRRRFASLATLTGSI